VRARSRLDDRRRDVSGEPVEIGGEAVGTPVEDEVRRVLVDRVER